MKIGFCQFKPAFGDLETTLKAIENLLKDCKAELIVLPELCNSGYNFSSFEEAYKLSEEIGKSKFINFLEDLAKKKNMHIVSGFNERDGKELYNSSILIGPKGYIGKYQKIHLFLNEKDFFNPGKGLPVFDIGSCKIGMLVCFDWIFPEVWRVLALKGADIICHPSNLVIPGFAQKAIPIHALINGIYVITSNRIGSEKNLKFTGMSTIANPKGEVLCQASQDKDEVKVIDIDINLAKNKEITKRNDRFKDRRPEEYKFLTDSKK